ncbi:MAG TPA: acyl-CoA dehydrogenase family protein [Acidimicrobiales bacterium]
MTTLTDHRGSRTTNETTSWEGVASAVAADLKPAAASADVTGELSVEAFEKLRGAGLTSALVPAEAGGGGASHAEMGRVLRELGRGDPATAVTLSMHSHLVAAQVWRHHHGQDAAPVFAKVVAGAVLISTGASDWVGSNGAAQRVEGGYRVTARKSPASGCEVGDILVTSIRWEEGPDGPQVLHCAVPFSAEGVRVEKTWDTLGLRATGSHTVILDDVFVPDAAIALMRPADVWHPVWNTVVGAALPLIMSAYVGIADAAVSLALDLVRGRSDSHIVQLAGEMVNAHQTGVDAVEAMLSSSQNLRFDNTDEHASLTLTRKTVAADALIATVRLAIELSGGLGYTRSTDLERLYRDVHGCLFHPLPRTKQITFGGRVALGMSPLG